MDVSPWWEDRTMALDFDVSRAAVRLRHKQELVKAVHGAGDADESEWLEWKSTLDLTSAHGLFTEPFQCGHCRVTSVPRVGVRNGQGPRAVE
jgi:hypothetical protein